jgi:hypothetical protein
MGQSHYESAPILGLVMINRNMQAGTCPAHRIHTTLVVAKFRVHKFYWWVWFVTGYGDGVLF